MIHPLYYKHVVPIGTDSSIKSFMKDDIVIPKLYFKTIEIVNKWLKLTDHISSLFLIAPTRLNYNSRYLYDCTNEYLKP